MEGERLQLVRRECSRSFRGLTIALLLVLSGAMAGTLWLLYEARKERRVISEVLRTHSPETIDSLAPFPDELRWQFVLTVLLLCVLIASAVVLVLVLRGYLNSQQSLRDLARQATDILESLEHGIITGDPDGRVISTNGEAWRMLGLEPSGHGMTLEDIDRRCSGLSLASCARDVLRGEPSDEERAFSFIRGGHRVHLVVDSHLLRDEAGAVHGTVLHVRDVTERRLIRERMERMEGYMGLGPVAAGLQHEIKNPLGALSLHVQLLAERLAGVEDPDVHEHLGVIEAEVARIGAVLESFRDYAEANVLSRSVLDVGELVSHAVRLISPQARLRGMSVRVDLRGEGEGGPRVEGDSGRLQQVLLNLLLNGLEAMNGRGEVTLRIRERDGVVGIDVADEGPGVSPAAARNLFDPYFTTKKAGLGMGLAVCRKIARQHGGELEHVASASGAVFRLTLPSVPSHASL